MVNLGSFQNDQKVAFLFQDLSLCKITSFEHVMYQWKFFGVYKHNQKQNSQYPSRYPWSISGYSSNTPLAKITTTISWNRPRGARDLNETALTINVTHTYNRVNDNDLIAKIN